MAVTVNDALSSASVSSVKTSFADPSVAVVVSLTSTESVSSTATPSHDVNIITPRMSSRNDRSNLAYAYLPESESENIVPNRILSIRMQTPLAFNPNECGPPSHSTQTNPNCSYITLFFFWSVWVSDKMKRMVFWIIL